jgi:hypothetical protein
MNAGQFAHQLQGLQQIKQAARMSAAICGTTADKEIPDIASLIACCVFVLNCANKRNQKL